MAGLLSEMNWVIDKYGKRVLAICCVVLIVLLQVVFVMPATDAAADTKAGEELEVRVQYEGERGGKIRTLVVFSNSELESLGAYDTQYVNITRVGTFMKTAAHVVDLTNIVDAAGIDRASVKSFTFRTTDGYTMTFDGGDYIGAAGWYYPEIGFHATRIDKGDGYIQLEEGALDNGTRDAMPAIAIRSNSVKGFKVEPSYGDMDAEDSYRFLTGQTDLSYLRYVDEEGVKRFYQTKKADITAWDSVKYIYGIDIVLKGAPPLKGISLDVIGDDTKVGSQLQIQVTFEGDTLGIFSSSDVTWTSSDKSVATVDENGVVTILQEKEVTITAEAAGKTASVTINGGEDGTDEDSDAGKTDQDKKDKDKVKATTKAAKDSKTTKATTSTNANSTRPKAIEKEDKDANKKKVFIAREISIGNEIKPDPEQAQASVSVKSDAQALEEAEAYDRKIVTGSAAAAVLACGGGAVFRIRRFRLDMGLGIKWKK